jgi:hypothetical protein
MINKPVAEKSDAADAAVFNLNNLPAEIAFDHRTIIGDYYNRRY